MAMQSLKKDFDETRIKFENDGDSAAGYYMGSDTFVLRGDTITKQLLQNDDGETLSIVSGKALTEDMSEIEKGVRVIITYRGKAVSKNGKKYHKYDVQFDTEDRREV